MGKTLRIPQKQGMITCVPASEILHLRSSGQLLNEGKYQRSFYVLRRRMEDKRTLYY